MKNFNNLLLTPGLLVLLNTSFVNAKDINLNEMSYYSIQQNKSRNKTLKISLNNFLASSTDNDTFVNNPKLQKSYEAGFFSDTTTATFSLDSVIGAEKGADAPYTEAVGVDYQMQIGLATSFSGEDVLAATIDIGNAANPTAGPDGLNFDFTGPEGDLLMLDGLTYTFPVGNATVMVGDNTDISAIYTGACVYNGITDYMGNCGTGNSLGVGGNGVTAALAYTFDNGFSLAGGISSTPTSILTEEGTDTFSMEAAYSSNSYGAAVAYTDAEDKTYIGINGYYSFDGGTLPTISAGVEFEDSSSTHNKSGFMIGLGWSEVGPGSFELGLGTKSNYGGNDTEHYMYEASYVYPINDSVSITPAIYIREKSGDNATGILLKSSMSF